jgi:hypothetical protein
MKRIGSAFRILVGRLKGREQFGGLGNKLLLIVTEYSVLPECKPGITFNYKFI